MDRCKLEYMLKNIAIKEKNKILQLIDPQGIYEFSKHISNFLLDPNTTDKSILYELPELKYFPDEKEQLIRKYANIYFQINELCKKNEIFVNIFDRQV